MNDSPPSPAPAPPERSTGGSARASHLHRIAPLLLLAVGVAALVGAHRLGLGELTEPGPGLWPFLVAVLLAGSGLALVFLDDPAEYEPWTREAARIAAGLLGLAVFIVAFQLIGFLVSAFLMLALWLRFLGGESWRWALGLAAGGSIGLHLLFVVALGVPFPDGLLALVTGG